MADIVGYDETKVTHIKRRKIRAVLLSLKKGSSIFEACQSANVSTVSFWRWRKQYPRLERLTLAIMESRIAAVEDALFKNATEKGNVLAQIFFLTNRASDIWKDRRVLINNINAVKINNGKPVDGSFDGDDADAEQNLIEEFRKRTQ